MRRVGWIVLACALLALLWVGPPSVFSPAAGDGDAPAPRPAAQLPVRSTADPPPDRPRIAAIYPNPVAPEDRGEFLVLSVPPDTDLGRFAIRDADGRATLPNRSASGRVVVDLDTGPGPLRGAPALPSGLVVRASLPLANAGERIELRENGTLVDATAYPAAPEGELWRPTRSTDGQFVPRGATGFHPRSAAGVRVRAAVLPDARQLAIETVASADSRLLLAGYTFRSEGVADALIAAADRGVDVAVLVDGGPVGGIVAREAELLDRINRSGVPVAVLDGDYQRYRYHHAKYAVVDDAAFVTSENWQPSGTGGRGSRGWATVVESPVLAADLAAVFRADRGWRSARPWPSYRRNRTFRRDDPPAAPRYPRRFQTRIAQADRVTLVTAPDNAERRLGRLLDSADRSIRIQQVSIDPGHPLLRRAIAAARRGVTVRVLLSGAWYVREDNRNLTRRLNHLGEQGDLPLEVTLAEPRSRFSHLHVKGIIVDGERVYVGSLNWNNVSLRSNREVGVVIDDTRIASLYTRAFRADWRGGAWRLTMGTMLGGGVILATVIRRLRRSITFERWAPRDDRP